MKELLQPGPQIDAVVERKELNVAIPSELHDSMQQDADKRGTSLDEWVTKAVGLHLTVSKVSKSENERLLAEVPTGRIFPKKKKLEIDLDFEQTYAEWKKTHPQP